MKFFTRGWVHGDMTDEDADAVAPAYWRHLDTIDPPEAVLDLAHLNPHDAYILSVEHTASTDSLQLHLRCGDQQIGYFDAFVNFTGVMIQPAHVASLLEAKRPAEFEILYDEVDRADAGTFEYRLLLYPAGEIAFQFRDVTVVRRCVSERG